MASRLSYDEIKNNHLFDKIKYKSTKEIDSFNGIIGQERAEKAIKFGLNVKSKGYNIYICGMPGLGKTTFAKNFAKEIAKNEKTPDDMCYVYNFENPEKPKLLYMPAGYGIELKEDMEELIDRLQEEITRLFADKDYEKARNKTLKEFQIKREEKIKELSDIAKDLNFSLKTSGTGIYFMPIVDEEVVSEEDFDTLSEDEKESINKNSSKVQEKAATIMEDIKEYEKLARKELDDLDYTSSLFIVGRLIGELLEKYEEIDQIVEYLKDVKEEILEETNEFNEDESIEEDPLLQLLPMYGKRSGESQFSKYMINIMTDNSDLKGAPVVVEHNPSYSNIIGDIEYDNEYGNFTTDFMKIKPGALHRANGGYLIIQAFDLFSNNFAWESLRRVLRTGEISIDPFREFATGIALSGVKPEPAKIDIKVILVGTLYNYNLISYYDEDFYEFFKIRADFDYEMDYNEDNVKKTLGFIKKTIEKDDLLEFDYNSLGKLLEFSLRTTEKNYKLTAEFDRFTDIISEASAWAKIDNKDIVTEEYVKKAIVERENRLNLYEEKLGDMIESESILINTDGKKIGQINGLSIIDLGDYAFGNPSRITATTYMGKAGVVNIEKEAEMSGSTHDKGVQTIIGYLGSTYAQDFPLSMSCRIGFEQNYSGIDGDSASSTELYAIISSLSEMPIRQDIAVTGSINQFGEIQPIGGVSQKIEGFYDICKKRGITGTQGVIIPVQNIKDLVLEDEVMEAIKDEKFHIYPIKEINQGIELLMGNKAGSKNKEGKFPKDSIHGKVYSKLKRYHEFSEE